MHTDGSVADSFAEQVTAQWMRAERDIEELRIDIWKPILNTRKAMCENMFEMMASSFASLQVTFGFTCR
ncbi:unnamed protein product, partial [Mesorhabditis spiculigera]